MLELSEIIIRWYNQNKRDLPWRTTNDPYRIWLSEVILQQTRVEQGLSYYYKFIDKFPNVSDLANASRDEVMKTWEGLGYYSRARNLHETANLICEKFNGIFPDNYADLLQLKGIGPYTAAAIASFAFNESVAVVDGNVYRFLSRYFGIQTPIDSGRGKKEFLDLNNQLINKKNPGIYNQAIMEFGALQCKPKSPDCSICPLQQSCFAFENQQIHVLPIKEKKTKITTRYFVYFDISDLQKNCYIRKREKNDIWKELHEFPLLEKNNPVQDSEIEKFLREFLPNSTFKIKNRTDVIKHVLSHQHIFAHFIKVEVSGKLKPSKGFMILNDDEFKSIALPRLIEKYCNEIKF